MSAARILLGERAAPTFQRHIRLNTPKSGARKMKQRIERLSFLSFALVILLLPARALAVTCDDTAGKTLTAGSETTDLEVTGPCEVKAGTYTFHQVNIYQKADAAVGGSLNFDDDPNGITFSAESILVENGGSLVAGSAATPIGTTCSMETPGQCGQRHHSSLGRPG